MSAAASRVVVMTADEYAAELARAYEAGVEQGRGLRARDHHALDELVASALLEDEAHAFAGVEHGSPLGAFMSSVFAAAGGRGSESPLDAVRRVVRERGDARAALEERESDMHARIRAGYDTTVADCWRAALAKVTARAERAERERDEARTVLEERAPRCCAPILRGAGLIGADLSGANLRGADLYGANLRGADLRGADLSAADLIATDLSEARRSANDHPIPGWRVVDGRLARATT